MDETFTPPNDPDYPQPGVALGVVSALGAIGLVLPMALVLLVLTLHRVIPMMVLLATPVGLILAFWPNLSAWRRCDLRSVETAIHMSWCCAAISAVCAIGCLFLSLTGRADELNAWAHVAVMICLGVDAWLLRGWHKRIRKYWGKVRLCPRCGYDLSVSIADKINRCPECGRLIPLHKWEMAAIIDQTFGRAPWQIGNGPATAQRGTSLGSRT